jgi:Fic family protein
MGDAGFQLRFAITNKITDCLTHIERARGFLESAKLSDEWLRQMEQRALVQEEHHTTHIEGTQITLEQAEAILSGKRVAEADPNDVREVLNYRTAFEFVSSYLESQAPVTEGLSIQLTEVRERGEKIIKADVFSTQYHLSPRQHKAIAHLLEHGTLTIQEYVKLCPSVSRRTLQRDLSILVEKGLVDTEGATNRMVYILKDKRIRERS